MRPPCASAVLIENIPLLIENPCLKTGETTTENGNLGGDRSLFAVGPFPKTNRWPKLGMRTRLAPWFPQRVRSLKSFFAVPFFVN